MICIDPRAGSIGLPKLFPTDMVVVTELPAADVLLTSNDGAEFWTGIEFKRVNDLLSCIVTGRFAGTQLPALAELVDDYWLLVEGPMRRGNNGELMVTSTTKRDTWYQARVGNRYFDWSDWLTWKMTMETCTPLKVDVTQSRIETRDWILTAHEWWRRGKDNHRSHMVTDKSRERIEIVRASILRKIAEQLPGIGHDKARKVEAHFKTTFDMVVADESEWIKIEGIGIKMANRIVEGLKNGG